MTDFANLSDATREWVNKARSFEPLTLEQELDLGRRIKSGDRAAKERLFEHNLSLVTGVVSELSDGFGASLGPAVDVDDMIQEGNMALWDAIDAYDPERGCKLGGFAVPRIKSRIIRQMNATGRLIRIPDADLEINSFLSKAERALEQSLLRQPTQEELLAYVSGQVSARRATLAKRLCSLNRLVELDAPLGDDEGAVVSSVLEDQDDDFREAILGSSLPPKVINAIKKLTDTQRKILEYRFGVSGSGVRSYTEIADMFRREGVTITRQGVHAAYRAAIAAIRKEALA